MNYHIRQMSIAFVAILCLLLTTGTPVLGTFDDTTDVAVTYLIITDEQVTLGSYEAPGYHPLNIVPPDHVTFYNIAFFEDERDDQVQRKLVVEISADGKKVDYTTEIYTPPYYWNGTPSITILVDSSAPNPEFFMVRTHYSVYHYENEEWHLEAGGDPGKEAQVNKIDNPF